MAPLVKRSSAALGGSLHGTVARTVTPPGDVVHEARLAVRVGQQGIRERRDAGRRCIDGPRVGRWRWVDVARAVHGAHLKRMGPIRETREA